MPLEEAADLVRSTDNTADLNRLAVTPVTPALYENAGNGKSKVEIAKVKRLDFFPYPIGGGGGGGGHVEPPKARVQRGQCTTRQMS
jgi:hypothetical protein